MKMRAIELLFEIIEQNKRMESKLDSLLAETRESKKIQDDQLAELKKVKQ